MKLMPFRFLSAVFTVTALLVFVVGVRLSQRGRWLPALPGDVGPWVASDMPLPGSALEMLGNPPASGRRYENPFKERVEAHVIATAGFDAYKEPAACMAGYGYSLTAEKRINLFGKDGSVRALVLRNDADGIRLIMYYWIQYRDGHTETRGSVRDNRDVFPRFTQGLKATVIGQQNCIVRVYTQSHPADVQGKQARRNLNEVALAVHKQLKEGGAKQ